ncbi:MAG: large subunit ribosomal protein [Bacillota bacterium]|nr:large subunit ribosomal protein [Bacillota bacterium]MDK2785002.1 large subunit ribosomal protein [Bacillota bacterium]MDK2882595.1 large subunit ribosomal protein [Bacillota bacterium]
MKGILGRKLGMTQVAKEDGTLVPVTVIEAGPCVVVQKKTPERDGYAAVQLGFGAVRENKVNKPLRGHFNRHKVRPVRYLREVRVENPDAYEVGQEIKVDIFSPGERVDVTGISRGKGFAGMIKRWGGHRGPMAHGSKFHRAPGTLASPRSGGRVFPGRHMPGRMGYERVTVKNLEVVRVDPEKNLLLVKGAVPGARGRLVTVRAPE